MKSKLYDVDVGVFSFMPSHSLDGHALMITTNRTFVNRFAQ